MHKSLENLIHIQNEINIKINELNYKNYNPKIIAISKTFKKDSILPLLEYGQIDFGENKVQEANDKWNELKNFYNKVKLHMVGKLQTNKVKTAIKIFDFIHSLDSIKLANKISVEQDKIGKKPKLFIQINIGEEPQKSGIKLNELEDFYNNCKKMNLNIIGTMCLPPENQDSNLYFSKMKMLNNSISLSEISMGMSNDYLDAINYNSTYLRIGTKIFGKRN